MVALAFSMLLVQAVSTGADNPFPGEKSEWHGYVQYTFQYDGRTCYVVPPKTPAPGNPWIWRARFWGHEPQTDLALLEKGFYLVYCDVAGLFGNPEAVKHCDPVVPGIGNHDVPVRAARHPGGVGEYAG